MIGNDTTLDPSIILKGLATTDPALLTNIMNSSKHIANESALVPSEIAKNTAAARSLNANSLENETLWGPNTQMNLLKSKPTANQLNGQNSTPSSVNNGYATAASAANSSAAALTAPTAALTQPTDIGTTQVTPSPTDSGGTND